MDPVSAAFKVSGAWARVWRPLPLSLLLGFLTVAAFLPFFALAGYTLLHRVNAERHAEYERLEQLAANLAAAVDRELRGHIETAQVLSGSRDLQEGNIIGFWEHAEDAASQADGHFILIDRDHQQLVNTRRPVGSTLPKTANPGAVDDVLAARKAQVGNLGIGAVAQARLFAVRVPIVVGGEYRYVLSYVPRADAILSVVQESYRPDDWRASVIDGNGIIVARSRRHEEFFGKSANPDFLQSLSGTAGRRESVDLEGRASVTAFHASSLGPWTVLVWAPKDVLEMPAKRAERTLYLLMALATLATISAAYLAGRLIRDPFARLVCAAQDLGSGRSTTFSPLPIKEANVVGEALSEAARGIAAREAALRRSEESLKSVMRELSHRSKNLLAVVQAIVRQSARLAPDFDHFRTSFDERLAGLARSQDLLVQKEWDSVLLNELVAAQIGAFIDLASGRVSLSGPSLLLKPEAAQSLGMAFHELGTNAMKYGSLSVPEGRVDVRWHEVMKDDLEIWLQLRWEESRGPPVSVPEKAGFGTTVIEQLTASNLAGESVLEWRREGLVWHCEAPIKELTSAKTQVGFT